jgi:hypothetical protein
MPVNFKLTYPIPRTAAATYPFATVCMEKKQDRSAHMSIQHSDDESNIKANDMDPFTAVHALCYRSVQHPHAPKP